MSAVREFRDDFRYERNRREDDRREQERFERRMDDERQRDAFLEDRRRELERDAQEEAIRRIVNDPDIILDDEMVSMINDQDVTFDRNMKPRRLKFRQFERQNLLPSFSTIGSKKNGRKKTKSDKNMSKALALANKKLRKKNGELRAGKTQGDVMRLAHKLRRKMS